MKNRLRVLLAEREWSQAELAARLGVSRQTINAIETGKYDPSLPLAFQMADLFQMQIEEIFKRNQDASAHEPETLSVLKKNVPKEMQREDRRR